MKKDAYYFPHFCNARSDRKIKRLIKDLGIEGYGIYFMILETLREQTDFKYPLTDVDLLADEFGTSEAKLLAVVNTYDLFDIDRENNFFSPKMMLYLQPYIEKSERARLAAKKRWDNVKKDANAYANALPEHCESESKCNANQNASKGEEKKGEESKEKESKEVRHRYGEYKKVLLTDKQYNKLVNDYGEHKTLYLINKMDEWLQMKGKTYKDYNAALRNWEKKDKEYKPEQVSIYKDMTNELDEYIL